MRNFLFALAFTPVFLLTLVTQHSLACCIDHDQDGYGIAGLQDCTYPNQFDCDDDASDDPAICATCTCEDPDCALCARCINPGAVEGPFGDPLCGDGADNDCDTFTDMLDDDCFECTVGEECNDENPCTDDLCLENACVNENNTASCDDGDACTVGDVCAEGSCVAGDPLDADEDGHGPLDCGGGDCNDSDPNAYPGGIEGPVGDPSCEDGSDNDCNGYIDSIDIACQETGWSPGEEVDAAVHASSSRERSNLSNLLFSLLLPIGAVVLLRRAFRKR